MYGTWHDRAFFQPFLSGGHRGKDVQGLPKVAKNGGGIRALPQQATYDIDVYSYWKGVDDPFKQPEVLSGPMGERGAYPPAATQRWGRRAQTLIDE